MKITRRLQKRLKNLCHKWEWAWDHPFPGDIGQDGRWEISIYSLNDLAEAGFCGCAALAPLEDDQVPLGCLHRHCDRRSAWSSSSKSSQKRSRNWANRTSPSFCASRSAKKSIANSGLTGSVGLAQGI